MPVSTRPLHGRQNQCIKPEKIKQRLNQGQIATMSTARPRRIVTVELGKRRIGIGAIGMAVIYRFGYQRCIL
jgi:hypothetical protein